MKCLNAFTFIKESSSRLLSESAKEGCSNVLSVAVKDNIAVKGMPLTCASPVLSTFSAPYDADCVRLLKESGRYEVIGKTNMDEFGMGSSTRHSVHGHTEHPFLEGSTPGGSSGGSAAAVAAGLADIALGSDTGGSVRLPAAFCGIFGLKPAWGAVSRYGLVSYAPSLDCIGLLGRNVQGVLDAYQIISARQGCHDMSLSRGQDVPGSVSRIVLLKQAEKWCDREIWKGTVQMAELLAQSLKIDLCTSDWDRFEACMAAYYAIASIEATSCLSRYPLVLDDEAAPSKTGSDRGQPTADDYEQNVFYGKSGKKKDTVFGDQAGKRLKLGEGLCKLRTADVYKRACKVRAEVAAHFDELAANGGIVILPTSPHTPPTAGRAIEWDCDIFTIPISLTSLFALSVPMPSQPWAGIQMAARQMQFIYAAVQSLPAHLHQAQPRPQP